jgi:hypothetical protein
VIILAQQDDDNDDKPINSNFILIDIQLMVDLFSNPKNVHNIRPACNAMRVHYIKGMMATTQEADFGDMAVYFNANGIDNVLSLHFLGKKFHITYDSHNHGRVFKINMLKGIIEFNPTPKGQHTLHLSQNPEAAYLLVNNADLLYTPLKDSTPPSTAVPDQLHVHVTTVRQIYDGFTKKHIDQAATAQRLMRMIGSPSECNFQSLVHLNLLKDRPDTRTLTKNAHTIFGPDLATIRGKTVR